MWIVIYYILHLLSKFATTWLFWGPNKSVKSSYTILHNTLVWYIQTP